MTYLHKNKRFWKALQQIRALFANRNGCYIFALYSESYIHRKKNLEENTQNYIQNLTHLSCTRKLYKKIKLYKEVNSYTRKDYRNCWYKIGLNKTEEDVYWEVLLRRFLRGFLKLWRGRKLSQTTNRGNLWMKENIRWGGTLFLLLYISCFFSVIAWC